MRSQNGFRYGAVTLTVLFAILPLAASFALMGCSGSDDGNTSSSVSLSSNPSSSVSSGNASSDSGSSGSASSGSSGSNAPGGHTVTFMVESSVHATQTVADGDMAAPPNAPTREYTPEAGLYRGDPAWYAFEGWECGTDPWDFDATVSSNTTLVARWSEPSPIAGVPANDIGAAIFYVNNNTNASHTLLISQSTNYSPSVNNSVISNDADLTIRGLGTERTIQYDVIVAGRPLLTVLGLRSRVTLGANITLRGIEQTMSTASVDTPLVRVYHGTVTMEAGAKIIGHYTSGSGGGVLVSNDDAKFIMEGGEISGNTTTIGTGGGGIHIFQGGAFIMKDGVIFGNGANYGGGVYVSTTTNSTPSSFKISGGIVYGNNANPTNLCNTANTNSGAALYVASGGIAQYGNGSSWTDIVPVGNAREATISVSGGSLQP